MPVDPQKALAAEFERRESSYAPDDVILYHLGIGAGVPPTDAGELEYTYEKQLKVLPSFAVIPVFKALNGLHKVPGLDYELASVLHGEQDVEIFRPLPTAARLESQARIAGVYDKGKAALVVLEIATREMGGEPLFTNRFSIFLRGEGGFGSEAAPAVDNAPPAREPDHVVTSTTLPQQALLYRLTGDKNPLHADPAFAKRGGFDTPILHGLCSYGVVCKAAVDEALGGDVTRVARYQARFAGIAFPGETIITSLWNEGGRVLAVAKTRERGEPVISHCALTLR